MLAPFTPSLTALSIHVDAVAFGTLSASLKDVYKEIATIIAPIIRRNRECHVAFAGGSSCNLQQWFNTLSTVHTVPYFTFDNTAFYNGDKFKKQLNGIPSRAESRPHTVYVADRAVTNVDQLVDKGALCGTSWTVKHCSIARVLRHAHCIILGAGDDGHISNVKQQHDGQWVTLTGLTVEDLLAFKNPIFVVLDKTKSDAIFECDDRLKSGLIGSPLHRLMQSSLHHPLRIMVFAS